ncbi:hypothetical protein KUCAC02_019803, partial [Chaenocephalus aceratus]
RVSFQFTKEPVFSGLCSSAHTVEGLSGCHKERWPQDLLVEGILDTKCNPWPFGEGLGPLTWMPRERCCSWDSTLERRCWCCKQADQHVRTLKSASNPSSPSPSGSWIIELPPPLSFSWEPQRLSMSRLVHLSALAALGLTPE